MIPPRLLLLTDRSQLRLGRSLVRTIAECVAAGATHVVVRELDEPPAARAALVDAVLAAGATPIAAHGPLPACNAVLLPLSALPGMHPGTRTQGHQHLGASCHSAEEVRRAAAEGADFATLSPFAETPSKPGYGPPLPRSEYDGLPIPVYALAGITPANAAVAIAAGASGVAVMGEVMRAEEPGRVVQELLEAIS